MARGRGGGRLTRADLIAMLEDLAEHGVDTAKIGAIKALLALSEAPDVGPGEWAELDELSARRRRASGREGP